MIVEHIVRGNEVLFTASFLDEDAVPVEPGSVTLNISYMAASARAATAVTMAENTAGDWTGRWDSSGAYKGRVYWSIRATVPPAADEGFFELDANPSNPDPA